MEAGSEAVNGRKEAERVRVTRRMEAGSEAVNGRKEAVS
jgi:hypothetical protein